LTLCDSIDFLGVLVVQYRLIYKGERNSTVDVLELFLALAIIIGISKLAGSLVRQVGQPRVFGELVVGVLLGPSLIDFLNLPLFAPGHAEGLAITINEMAEIGVLLLMFNVGLEVHLEELTRVGLVAVLAGIIGALLPVGLTMVALQPFDFNSDVVLFVGVTLAATSVSISAQTLLELGLLRTKEGFALLATALIDDVLAILLLSFAVATTATEGTASASELLLILLQMTVYIVGAGLLAWFILPRFINFVEGKSQLYGTASAGIVAALLFGWSAEEFGGVAFITGAFIAGLGLSQASQEARQKIGNAVTYIAYAFFVPIFFVNVGLQTDLSVLDGDDLEIAAVLLVVAMVSKILGAGVGARLGGFNNGESFRLGVAMISRGEVGLIIASVGLREGIFDDSIFPALFLIILLTTVVTPPFVRYVFRETVNDDDTQPAPASG